MLDIVLTPIDALIGIISFGAGAATVMRFVNNRPLRTASIFLQVSFLIVKMAEHYFKTHPEAKDKLNEYTVRMLEKVHAELLHFKYIEDSKEPLG